MSWIIISFLVFWVFCTVTAYKSVIGGYKQTSFINRERQIFASLVALFGPVFWFGVFFSKLIIFPILRGLCNLSETLNSTSPEQTRRKEFINAIYQAKESIYTLYDSGVEDEDKKIFKIQLEKLDNELDTGIELYPDETFAFEQIQNRLREMKKNI